MSNELTTTPTSGTMVETQGTGELALVKKYGNLTRELVIIEMCRAARADWNMVKDISQGSMNQIGITQPERDQIEAMMANVFDHVLAPYIPVNE
jgi:hypothetical protein